MRILVASQYFRPESGATQNRMASFVDGLADRGHEVTVVCEQPNHPAGVFAAGYGRRPVVTERSWPITTHRLWVAASPRKTTMNRLAFYATFAAGAGAATALATRHDVVFATSPPLPGALSVAAVARSRGMPIVLDVRDIWPAAAHALGELSNPKVIHVFERAERWLYRSSKHVTTTTRPFCRHIDAVAGREVAVHLPNGALDELLRGPAGLPPSGRPFTVGYAGNLGIAQGLGIILDAAAALADAPVRFVVLGDGPLAGELRSARDARGLSSIEFRPGVPVSQVGDFLRDCDALLVPLRDHPLLRDFIPSKLYDAMAVGRPILVAAAGEPAALVRDLECGLEVRPEDGDDLARAVKRLMADPGLTSRLGHAGRAAAGEHARSRQVERLEALLLDAAGAR